MTVTTTERVGIELTIDELNTLTQCSTILHKLKNAMLMNNKKTLITGNCDIPIEELYEIKYKLLYIAHSEEIV